MSATREEIEKIVAYAEKVKITAGWNPEEFNTVLFKHDPPLPNELSDDTKELIEFCFTFYQRAVFTGELEMNYPKPANLKSDNILEDLNMGLEHYRDHLIFEVKKALGLIEPQFEPGTESDPEPELTKKHRGKAATSLYTKAMLQFKTEQKKTKK